MKYILLLVLLIPALAIFNSCRSTKKIQTAISKKDTVQAVIVDSKADSTRFIKEVYSRIIHNNIDYKTFSAKIKVTFEGSDGKKPDFNAFVRLQKDSVMWISINAVLGIEAFRVLITPDSVKVLNKLDKEIQFRSVEYLREVARIPLTFHDLQDLLIGNPVYLDSNIVSYKQEDRAISLISVGQLFKHLLTVGNSEYELQHSKLDDLDAVRSRTADITYGDYENKDGFRFSTYRKITVSEKSKLEIEMQFKQFNFNEELSFPFNIPRNYKRQN